MALKRAAKEKEQAGLPMAEDRAFKEQYPTLYDFLTQTAWEDGARRKCGTLMILAEGGRWKGWVHDQDGKRSAWITSGTVADVFGELNAQLEDDTVAWRPDRK